MEWTINTAHQLSVSMLDFAASYRKATYFAAAVALLAAVLAASAVGFLVGPLSLVIGCVLSLVTLCALLLAICGAMVLRRHLRSVGGHPDLFLALNTSRSESSICAPDGFRAGSLRRIFARTLLGHELLVGDEVEVCSREEILATLDPHGAIAGIPFQAEMLKFCGQRGRVFRNVDKIYDYGRTKRMRRVDGCVLVVGLRCNGSDHGGCQAQCYLIWNVSWLRRPNEKPASAAIVPVGHNVADWQPHVGDAVGTALRYQCQFTQLHAASKPLSDFGIGKEIRPWIAGNVTLGALCVGIATRAFNFAQSMRSGIGFPAMAQPTDGGSAVPSETLAVGDRIQVRPMAEIAQSLNKSSRNKGLWFDRDMLKHCGGTFRVLARVDRIIDDSNGEMRQMKTPCIVLDGVHYSGEFLSFNAQHDYFFWREAWLKRLSV